MKRFLRMVSASALLAAAMAISPLHTVAQETNTPPAEKPPVIAKPKSIPFHGALIAIDKTQMTLTIGERTFQITSATRIHKDGKPAIFADAVVGDMVGGAYKKTDEGKLIATTINLGVKPEKPPQLAKPAKPAKPAVPAAPPKEEM